MSRVIRVAIGVGAVLAGLGVLVAERIRRLRVSRAVLPALPPAPPPGRGVRIAQRVLVGLGVALLVVAAVLDVTVARPKQLPELLLWMAAAVLLHDAVLSPLALGANLVARRAGRRLPPAALAVAQVAVVVGVVLTAVIAPAIRSKQLGTSNPTVLPLDYTTALVVTLAVLALIAVIAAGLGAGLPLLATSRRLRSPKVATRQ